jgi:hypothetical protein
MASALGRGASRQKGRKMTVYYLKFWGAASGKTSNPLIPAREINRLYLNAEDGSNLGYIERRLRVSERRSNSDYDRHRRAKGDTTETIEDVISTTLPPEVMTRLIETAAQREGYEFLAKYATPERQTDAQVWQSLLTFARGVDWLCDRKRAKQFRQQALGFTITI